MKTFIKDVIELAEKIRKATMPNSEFYEDSIRIQKEAVRILDLIKTFEMLNDVEKEFKMTTEKNILPNCSAELNDQIGMSDHEFD